MEKSFKMIKKLTGFSLLEVLVVLFLLVLIFSLLFFVFDITGLKGTEIKRESEILKEKAYLFYTLKHQLEGMKRSLIVFDKNNEVKLIFFSPFSEKYPDGAWIYYWYIPPKLFYCESLYPPQFFSENPEEEKFLCKDKKNFFSLGEFENFRISVYVHGKWLNETFNGPPPNKIKIWLDNFTILVNIKTNTYLR